MDGVRSFLRGAKSDEVMLVTGSLYLLGRVRPFLVRMRETETLEVEA